jgi:hypothetical protein
MIFVCGSCVVPDCDAAIRRALNGVREKNLVVITERIEDEEKTSQHSAAQIERSAALTCMLGEIERPSFARTEFLDLLPREFRDAS